VRDSRLGPPVVVCPMASVPLRGESPPDADLSWRQSRSTVGRIDRQRIGAGRPINLITSLTTADLDDPAYRPGGGSGSVGFARMWVSWGRIGSESPAGGDCGGVGSVGCADAFEKVVGDAAEMSFRVSRERSYGRRG